MATERDNFPSLTLCRGIPEGMLTDTQFVWVKTPGGVVFVMERADAASSEVKVLAPAPTETECHMEAEELGRIPVIPDRAARALVDLLHPDQKPAAHADCKNGKKYTMRDADDKRPSVPPELAERFAAIRKTVREQMHAGETVSAALLCGWAVAHKMTPGQLCLAAECHPDSLYHVNQYVVEQFRKYYGIELED